MDIICTCVCIRSMAGSAQVLAESISAVTACHVEASAENRPSHGPVQHISHMIKISNSIVGRGLPTGVRIGISKSQQHSHSGKTASPHGKVLYARAECTQTIALDIFMIMDADLNDELVVARRCCCLS